MKGTDDKEFKVVVRHGDKSTTLPPIVATSAAAAKLRAARLLRRRGGSWIIEGVTEVKK
jgi:hypothetical protein